MKFAVATVMAGVLALHFAAACNAQAVAEGTWTEKNTTALGEETTTKRTVKLTVAKDMLKIEDSLLAETTIVRLDTKLLWLVDTKAKTYIEITFEQIVEARKRMVDDIKVARGHVKGSSEEGRLTGILETLCEYEKGEPAASTAQPGESKDVAGKKTERTVVKLGDAVVVDVWTSADIAIETPFFAFFTALQGCETKLAGELAKVQGMPLAGTFKLDFLLKLSEITFEFTSVAAAEPAEADFALPDGLKKVESPEFSASAKPAEKSSDPEDKK